MTLRELFDFVTDLQISNADEWLDKVRSLKLDHLVCFF